MRDFTLDAYLCMLRAARNAGLVARGVAYWIENNCDSGILIRHDVDRCPINALRMAEAEANLGISTTYYFRVVGSAWSPTIIRAIHELGHEVGYHYEDLALAEGSIERAVASFGYHLEMFREIVPVRTAAMHGSPMSRQNNLDIWRHTDLAAHELIGEAFLTVNYSNMYYLTDTGRSWSPASVNLRDRPKKTLAISSNIKNTNDVIDFIGSVDVGRIAISVHPERWNAKLPNWLIQWGRDAAINNVKRVLTYARK